MPDYLVTDPATGQRIKMTGPAPPSEALIRLALAKVQPLPSHDQLLPQKQGPEQPTNAFGQTLPLSPEQDYPGKAIQSILGFLGLGNDDARSNRFGQLLAAGMPIMGALKKIGVGEEAARDAIIAWHASPHDFERFDMTKIGTGEGAQAYGHGLYFAQNPEVSGPGGDYHRSFTRALQSQNPITYKGGAAVPGTLEHRMLSDVVNDGLETTIQHWEHSIASNREYAPDQANLQRAVLDKVKGIDPASIKVPKARSYEVSIKADPDQFLDWDKPLSQQPQQVKEIANKAFSGRFTTRPVGPNLVDVFEMRPDGRPGGSIGVFPPDKAPDVVAHPADYLPYKGEQLYRELAADKWPSGAPRFSGQHKPEAATEALRQAGIPGIKYLDQGSRTNTTAYEATQRLITKYEAAGNTQRAAALKEQLAGMNKPTSNYVVFDDKLIDILKKYAVAGAVGGSLASLGQPPTEEQK